MAMTLRTDAELDEALSALAEVEGLSRQEVVRRAVLARLAQLEHRQIVEASADRNLERWKEVLDRLGSM